MTTSPEPIGQPDLITRAAQLMHDVRHQGHHCNGQPLDSDYAEARALADAGLLADLGYMPWGRTVDEGVQGALRHLSTLASTAGKRRTAEWLAECAELVMAPGSPSWPPAPAYKGPMVPAAVRDALQARIDAATAAIEGAQSDQELGDALWRIEGNYHREGTGPGSRFEDQMLTTVQARWIKRELFRNVRAALQGDQPTEPEKATPSPLTPSELPASPTDTETP